MRLPGNGRLPDRGEAVEDPIYRAVGRGCQRQGTVGPHELEALTTSAPGLAAIGAPTLQVHLEVQKIYADTNTSHAERFGVADGGSRPPAKFDECKAAVQPRYAHLHPDWAHHRRIFAGTGLTTARVSFAALCGACHAVCHAGHGADVAGVGPAPVQMWTELSPVPVQRWQG